MHSPKGCSGMSRDCHGDQKSVVNLSVLNFLSNVANCTETSDKQSVGIYL